MKHIKTIFLLTILLLTLTNSMAQNSGNNPLRFNPKFILKTFWNIPTGKCKILFL